MAVGRRRFRNHCQVSRTFGCGQYDLHDRTLPHDRADRHRATSLRHDTVARGKPKSRSLARVLGREERLQRAESRLFGHARTGVADHEHDDRAGWGMGKCHR